jgi:RNA polymerase sigma factor (sigma-70 family)
MTKLKILSTKVLPEHTEEFLPFFLGNTEEEAEANYNRFSQDLNKMAAAYSRNTGLEKEDLFGAGLTGLARALRDYDPNRTDNFFVYASYRIRSVLNDYCFRNKSIVPVPQYIALAHGYINKIRNILLKYPKESITDVLTGVKQLRYTDIPPAEKNLCKAALEHLKTLSKNSGVPYNDLVERSEYIPINVLFEESYLTTEDFEVRDVKQIQLTALISTIRDKMTAKELTIADGIMMGKTYDEIGAEQTPRRSASWVRKQLGHIRKRILEDIS